jgi:D,D-heptose 1,7-bisphosphate phosphatase
MNKALFLDRDGVVNQDLGYVCHEKNIHFVSGIFELCLEAKCKNYLIIIITNQSGIERGYYTDIDFQKVMAFIKEAFRFHNISIDDVFYCPWLCHEDRKPNPGMFLKAQYKHNIDMGASIAIGDAERDIEAAQRAGVGKTILFAPKQATHTKAHYQFSELSDCVHLL